MKVVVITGGGTGIGAATAEELASAGAAVVISGRRPGPLNDVVARITSKGGIASAYPLDITDFAALERLAEVVAKQFGHVDLLMPNAAVHDVSLLADGNPDWWHTLIDINVVGLLNTIRAFLPKMIKQESGRIIIMSSVSGRVSYVGEAVYEASKHAQAAIAECLRLEVSDKGIGVTIVEPGVVDTPMLYENNPFAAEIIKTVTPLAASDVARVVRFIFELPPNCVINELMMRPLKQMV